MEAHVCNGEYEASRVYAYVYIEQAVHSPHLFIKQAMENVCGAPAFHLAASAHGIGIMVFGSPEAREQVVAQSPSPLRATPSRWSGTRKLTTASTPSTASMPR